MRYLILFLSVILLFTACRKAEQPPQNASANAKRYNLKGKVVAVDKTNKKATIDHSEIPEMPMKAMTMTFPIRADWVWDDLTKGSEIRAELVVDKDSYWLENIGIVAAPDPKNPAPAPNENFAQVGNEVPNFTLTNQDGKLVLSTMVYDDEVNSPEDIRELADLDGVDVSDKELSMAEALIESLSAEFKPEQFMDTHRNQVLPSRTQVVVVRRDFARFHAEYLAANINWRIEN